LGRSLVQTDFCPQWGLFFFFFFFLAIHNSLGLNQHHRSTLFKMAKEEVAKKVDKSTKSEIVLTTDEDRFDDFPVNKGK
jgi:hypothetical protein